MIVLICFINRLIASIKIVGRGSETQLQLEEKGNSINLMVSSKALQWLMLGHRLH